MARKKVTRRLAKVSVVPGKAAGNFVLEGVLVDEEMEKTRTTKIIGYDAESGIFETFNAFYQVV